LIVATFLVKDEQYFVTPVIISLDLFRCAFDKGANPQSEKKQLSLCFTHAQAL